MENIGLYRLFMPVRRLFGLQNLLELRRQRRALAQLDTHLLRDIGLDRTAAESEAQRPLWDVPQSWRRQNM